MSRGADINRGIPLILIGMLIVLISFYEPMPVGRIAGIFYLVCGVVLFVLESK